ncbi:MAG: type II toxin-antitoxin system RelE/ParE family toxin [Cytophagales bacterium]|nr:MAG: type II toxin-antitoxin system RelE/ParE family toxin [Cytophagales bacterium]
MANYTVILSSKARKQLDNLSDHIASPVLIAIADLGEDPRPNGYKKLKGRDGYRIRAGNYRIIYEIFDTELVIDIITVGHRKDIYN